ncbi:ABC transporter substrate-binding protein [Frigidibacter sp. MR17.24]|uniref:ABC transporter substrate-binding protein n=1 Tax=Frigidibacter sp. MR17.24 TaxID=3127345 RepID=UPI0030131A96
MMTWGGAAAAGLAALPAGPARAAREGEMNILCWEGYNSAQVLDPFRAATGARVRAESLTNDPTMINRLRAGETATWDLINVNNPWARKVMAPEGLIRPLPRAEFEPFFDAMLPAFKAPYRWAMSEDGRDLLGMAQRFGPFSFVVDTDRIARATAEDQGWDLFNDPGLDGRYGIFDSDDWNVFNLFLIAGLDPFRAHDAAGMQRFRDTTERVVRGAKMIGDMAMMNQALVSGEIDLHMTGGVYSVSPARADGFSNLRAITPLRGPMDGRGGISWIEITSTVNNPALSPRATEFLKFVQSPEMAHAVAFAEGTFNPVAQMGDPACFARFTTAELEAIQWDSLEEDMARSAEYDIVPDYDEALAILTAAKRLRG